MAQAPEVPPTSLPGIDGYLNELLSPEWDGDFHPILGPLFDLSDTGLMPAADGSVAAYRNRHLKALAVHPALGHVPANEAEALVPTTADSATRGLRRFLSEHIFSMNPPLHRPARQAFSRQFTQGKMAAQSDLADQAVDFALRQAADNSPVDCQRDLAIGITTRFWAQLIGLTEEETALAARLAEGAAPMLLAQSKDDVRDSETDLVWEYMEVISSAIQRRLDEGESELLTEMASELETIDVAERPANVGELLGAALFDGFDTLSRGLSNLIYALTMSEGQPLDSVRRDRSLVGPAYFEGLRLHPPILATYRFALEAVDVDSLQIPQGTPVMMLWLFGNRDPEVFRDPEAFMFDRPTRAQSTFGGGAYVCPGRGVTKVLGEALIRGIAGDDFAISPAGKPRWTPGWLSHTLDEMPIDVSRR